MVDNPAARPIVKLKQGHQRRVRAGCPWVYSNEIEINDETKALEPGTLVNLVAADARAIGTATLNLHNLISARILSRDPQEPIDVSYFAHRIRRALYLRECIYRTPFYRLVHAEADGIGGLIVDRFGEILVAQLTTAGMEQLSEAFLTAADQVLAPRAVMFRNDRGARRLEGLDTYIRAGKGRVTGPIEIPEGGAKFLADLDTGQKTGWFYDQRDNRAFVAELARDRRLLDVYCYVGGFAISAAVRGASEVLGIDRSTAAIALATEAARKNGIAESCTFRRGDAFTEMARLAENSEKFDVVIVDPPAFVKSRKDLPVGIRGYRKMVRLAASLVAPSGYLFAASCSHNVDDSLFAEQVRHGLQRAGRTGRILRRSGAGPDHPVHPFLPETAYLKAELLQLD